jgi:hypothetical protein
MNAAGFTGSFDPTLDWQRVIPVGFKWSRLNKAGSRIW